MVHSGFPVVLCTMYSVSLDGPLLIARCLVYNVLGVSGWSILDCPLSCVQYTLCLWMVHSVIDHT